MAYVGAVMTLPGIAGFVLTMGIGVDSNVLIFERIKEELEAQRGVRASINAGFSRVFLTLLDTHVAALISAAFLFNFGTGPIRGFAVTLVVGLLSNLFTATFVSKTLFELVLSRQRQVATLSHLAMHIFKNTNYDFLRWRWHAVALSWVVILAGVVVIVTKGIAARHRVRGRHLGHHPVRAAGVDRAGALGARSDSFSGRTRHPGLRDSGAAPGADPRAAESARNRAIRSARRRKRSPRRCKQANLGKFDIVGTEIVSPTVGRELTSKGTWATVLSLAGILLYIAFRYQLSFAVGAVVATMHDLLVTLAFLAFFRYDLSLNVIAAILTVTGYSTNDTIVIFDRVRENLRGMRRDSLNHVINHSINQTLGRTVLTAGTTLLSAVALVPVRRRGAARLCVHDDRRHHHRHLFERVRGGGDRHVLARSGTDEGRRARAGEPPAGAAPARRAAADAQVEAAAQGAGVVVTDLVGFRLWTLGFSDFGSSRASYLKPKPKVQSLLHVHHRSSRAARCRAGSHRVSAGLVDGASPDRRAAARVSGSGQRVHRDDPARIDPRDHVAVSRQDPGDRRRAADPTGGAAICAGRVRRAFFRRPSPAPWRRITSRRCSTRAFRSSPSAFVLGGIVMLVVERFGPRADRAECDDDVAWRRRPASVCTRCWP